jgi:hypothetical protein
LQFESEPSSSTYTPYSQTHSIPYTHVEGDGEKGDDEDEADSEHEGIIEESENEEDYHDNIYDNDDDQTQSAYDPTPLSAYNPPPHMRTLDLATIDQQTEGFEHYRLPIDVGIAVGMEFHTKADCARAIKQWHVSQSLNYKVKYSDTTRYVIQCKQPLCRFKLRASPRVNKRWMIGIINETHTCTSFTLSQDHSKLDSRLICDNIESLLHTDLSVKIKVIIAHIRDKFNYTITNRKA